MIITYKYPLFRAYIEISHDGVRWDRGTSNYPLIHSELAPPILEPTNKKHRGAGNWKSRKMMKCGIPNLSARDRTVENKKHRVGRAE